MTTKKNNNQQDDDIKYAFFCDSLEKQYAQAKKNGLFDALKIFELDEEHSDPNVVQAVKYFKDSNGLVENDAPMSFLTEREKIILHENGQFRQALYCMLLSKKFADAIENKSIFLKHSFKYAFEKS